MSRPLTHLINLSFAEGIVPLQWKSAVIHPLPKIPQPKTNSDLRPISVVPILSRISERIVVKDFINPSIWHLPPHLDLINQFAYRPTSSTTAALIAIFQTITDLLVTNPYVHCITFDYSKAFDTLSHSSVASSLANVDLPDHIYNWIIDYLFPRTHVTTLNNITSTSLPITAGIVQGSVLGPTLFNINSSTLRPISPSNYYFKYADDGYLIVPANNSLSIPLEIAHQTSWAASSNLKLNLSKTAEIIFTNKRAKPPPPTQGVLRVTSIKILGVTVDDKLNFSEHVDSVITSSNQTFFALKTLRQNGLSNECLAVIFRVAVVPKLLYAAPSYWGFLNAQNRSRLEATLNKAIRFGYYSPTADNLTSLQAAAERKLFLNILHNSCHVLNSFLPPKKVTPYNLRQNSHGLSLPRKDDRNFLSRLLYQDIY